MLPKMAVEGLCKTAATVLALLLTLADLADFRLLDLVKFDSHNHRYMSPAENLICEPSRLNIANKLKPNEYITCIHSGDRHVWRTKRCTPGTIYTNRLQKCISKRAAKRQESLCRVQPNSFACLNKCAAPNDTMPVPGAACVWTDAHLENAGAGNPSVFLQCNPTSLGSVCGVWNQMQCSNGTVFNLFVQVCITITIPQTSCPIGEIPMFACGAGGWCPAGAMCRENVCCQPVVGAQLPAPGGDGMLPPGAVLPPPAPPTLYPPQPGYPHQTTPTPYYPTLRPAPLYPQPNLQPVYPGQQQPSHPGQQQPGYPGQQQQPSYPGQQPGYPGQHQQPGYPGQQQQPGYPGQQESGYPGQQQQTGYPGQQQQPGYPGQQQQPGYPGQQQQPGYSGQQESGYPGQQKQQQPGYPGQQQPSYPGQQQPSYPGQQQPGYPGHQQPGYSGQQQPGYPGQQQPSYPGQQQPGYPGQQNQGYPHDIPQPPSVQPPYQPSPSGSDGYNVPSPTAGQQYPQHPPGVIYPQQPSLPPEYVQPSPGARYPGGQAQPQQPYGPSVAPNHEYPTGHPQPGSGAGYPQHPGYPDQGQQQTVYPGPPAYPGVQPYVTPNPSPQQPYPQQPFTQPQITLYPPHTTTMIPRYTTPRYLPICLDGQPARSFCKQNYECPEHHGCTSAGGCCPLPTCPNGAPSYSFCNEMHDCVPNQFCHNGGCCSVLSCPNGEKATRSCDANNPCPSPFTCQSGACCASALPDCPNMKPATMPCSSPGTCPDGYYCQSDKSGYRHGCCEIPVCPDGQAAIQPCGDDLRCPAELQCVNNACCRPFNGGYQTTPAALTYGPTAPNPYQQPHYVPLPTVAVAITPPAPYGQQTGVTWAPTLGTPKPCTGCCPTYQVAVCMCSNFMNMCPQMTSCSRGACCATRDVSPKYLNKLKPGDRCTRSEDCPDSEAGLSQCSNGHCVCHPNTMSDGFTCVPVTQNQPITIGKPYLQATNVNTDKGLYRRTIRSANATFDDVAPNENLTDLSSLDMSGEISGKPGQFIYWRTFTTTFCVTNRECIPEMTCINGTCFDVVQNLNSEPCTFDEQCSRGIPNSHCGYRTAESFETSNSLRTEEGVLKNCQCEPGYYEFKNKCWKKCPKYTSRLYNKCVLTRDISIVRKFFPSFGKTREVTNILRHDNSSSAEN